MSKNKATQNWPEQFLFHDGTKHNLNCLLNELVAARAFLYDGKQFRADEIMKNSIELLKLIIEDKNEILRQGQTTYKRGDITSKIGDNQEKEPKNGKQRRI